MTTAEGITAALDEKHQKDRSVGAWAIICAALRRGHSPTEVLAMVLDHIDVGCFAKYAEKSDPEGALRCEIKKAFLEEKPASETLDGLDLNDGAEEVAPGKVDARAELNKTFAIVRYGT